MIRAEMRVFRVVAMTIFWLAQTAMPVAVGQATQARAVAVPDAAQIERRLQSVRTLVESSSAARQIDSSGKPEAIAQRNRARGLLQLAEEAYAARDFRSANGLLDDAARQLFASARQTGGPRADGERADFAARMESTRALLAAQKRIAVEKSAPGAADTGARIERLMAQASQAAEGGNFAEARPLLDQAYLTAKAAIGSLRGGDTLVRVLTFASKEEEYHYEVDRNDTHRMLVKLLVERQAGGNVEIVRSFVEKANGLRGQAEASARRNDFEGATRLLEDATRELVRAIRNAGIYIPG